MATQISVLFDKTQPGLIVQQGPTAQKHRGLLLSANTVGQARGCDVVLDAPEVSSLHCLITRGPEGLSIRDCSSRTGTFVNEKRIWEAPLHDGDLVTIGSFTLQVYLPASCLVPANGVGAVARPETLDKDRQALAQEAKRCEELKQALAARQNELTRQEGALRDQLRDHDQKKLQLEEAQKQLDLDREAVIAESKNLEGQVQQVEQELGQRQAQVEADVQTRLQECDRQCEERKQALTARENELAGKEESLRNRLQEYEQRKLQLVETQQQLDLDRETLTADREALTAESQNLEERAQQVEKAEQELRDRQPQLEERTQQVEKAEQELRDRQAQVEADTQTRLQESQQRREESERPHAETPKPKAPPKGPPTGSGIFSTEEVQQRLRAIEAKLTSSRHPRQ
jgi:hypothetical protein